VSQHYDSEDELIINLTVTILVLRHMTPCSAMSFQRHILLSHSVRRVPLKRPYTPTTHQKTAVFVLLS